MSYNCYGSNTGRFAHMYEKVMFLFKLRYYFEAKEINF